MSFDLVNVGADDEGGDCLSPHGVIDGDNDVKTGVKTGRHRITKTFSVLTTTNYGFLLQHMMPMKHFNFKHLAFLSSME